MRKHNSKRVAGGTLLAAVALAGGYATMLAAAAPPLPNSAQTSAAAASPEEKKYDEGRALLNSSRWAEAESAFKAVAQMHGTRADAGLYWQAYAENKMGHSADALETCSRLRTAYPRSTWIKDCGVLEIEIHKESGGVSPQSEQDEDLKLLALNALAQQDRPEAVPILKGILSGNQSPKMKERALFVLTQMDSKESQDVLAQVARGQSGPELQIKAIHMLATMEGKRANGILDGIYRSSSDLEVKKAILQSYLVSDDSAKLLDAARGETNPMLIRTAVHTLGAMGEADQLLTLYRASKTADAKAAIIDAFVPCGERANAALKEIATTETDSQLRRKAIRNLGVAGGRAGSMLVEIYQKSSDPGSKEAALDGLFVAGDAHDLVALARAEKEVAMKKKIVEKLSIMDDREATQYMMELLK
ncbi:MAG TPA: HEAT repeat domain-containing protein [Bryobacteraceae bacterium]|nr:HEAT repeat domain-containing protein [Bryobacteraceae bacterium]